MSEDADKSIDFDQVASYYDAHVDSTLDLPFWVELCGRLPGPHLELMCGSGRISLALLAAGIPLTCVDYSTKMLARLRAKLTARPGLAAATLIDADVRELVLDRRFGCVLIGFHAISELSELDDLRRALQRIAALLERDGALLISMHEPHVRGPACDGRNVALGVHPLSAGASVEVSARWQLQGEAEDGLVVGTQVYVECDDIGRPCARVELPVRFRLWSAATLEREAAAVGLSLRASYEGYTLPLRPPSAGTRMRVLEFVSDETARARAG